MWARRSMSRQKYLVSFSHMKKIELGHLDVKWLRLIVNRIKHSALESFILTKSHVLQVFIQLCRKKVIMCYCP